MASQLLEQTAGELLEEMKGENRPTEFWARCTISAGRRRDYRNRYFYFGAGVTGPALMLSFVLAAALCGRQNLPMFRSPINTPAYPGELFACLVGTVEYAVGSATVAHGWSALSEFIPLFGLDKYLPA
jgi:hypothetical protein